MSEFRAKDAVIAVGIGYCVYNVLRAIWGWPIISTVVWGLICLFFYVFDPDFTSTQLLHSILLPPAIFLFILAFAATEVFAALFFAAIALLFVVGGVIIAFNWVVATLTPVWVWFVTHHGLWICGGVVSAFFMLVLVVGYADERDRRRVKSLVRL